jgi:PAS domain S-box-containing protein
MSTAEPSHGDTLESLFEVVPQLLCVIGPDGRLERVNPQSKVMMGFEPCEIEGTSLLDLAHPDDVEAVSAALAAAQAGQTVLDFSARFRAKDGSFHDLQCRAGSRGGRSIFASARDVTVETATAAELERQRTLLAETERAAHIGSFRIDPATLRGSRSDGILALFGVERDRTEYEIGDLAEHVVHPDDMAQWHRAIDSALTGRLEQGAVELRFMRSDGAIRWGHLQIRQELGADGKPVALVGFVQDITERKEADLALVEGESLLKESQQVARVGHYLFDTVADHWDGSEVLYDIFGIGPDHVRDFEGWVGLCHPDDQEMMRRYVLEEVLGRRALFDKQYRIVRPSDGATRWMSGHGRLNLDGDGTPVSLFGVIQDITEIKDVEEQLRVEKDNLAGIMDTSPVGILLVGPDGQITMANRRAVETLGIPKGDITARTFDGPQWQSMTMEGRPFAREELPVGRVLDSGRPVWDARMAVGSPDGEQRFLSVNAAPLLDLDGTLSGVVAAINDITAFVHAEGETRGLNQDLEGRVRERTAEVESAMRSLAEMNLRLEEASAAKSRLLANMSHELRTPLNSVIGFSTILLQDMAGPLNDEQRRQLEMIKRAGRMLLSLVDEVLDLSRVEAGASRLELSDFPVDDAVAATMESMQPLAQEKGLTLDVSVGCRGLTMHSDAGKLAQILLNLLSNAIKFTDQGTVACECESHNGEVVFRVTDTGIGIPDDELPLIMEDFHQVDRLEDGMKPHGTGLGLAISWRLADMLGGTLTAESRLGEGSTFTLRVPARLERRAANA